MSETRPKAPIHLWIVGVVALLWDTVGVVDYLATQTGWEPYMSNFTPEQLAYFEGFPAWTVAAWALAVWCSWVGAIALLLRRAWAVPLFGVAIAGLAVTTLYNFGLSNGLEIMGAAAAVFTVVIWIVAVFLFVYARAQARAGVLR